VSRNYHPHGVEARQLDGLTGREGSTGVFWITFGKWGGERRANRRHTARGARTRRWLKVLERKLHQPAHAIDGIAKSFELE
jgi:hypothetical protein